MSSSPSPFRAHFTTREIEHLVFNFHRDADLDDIEAVLRFSPERSPTLLVVGTKGLADAI